MRRALCTALVAAAAAVAGPTPAATVLPNFARAHFKPGAYITNRYFPLSRVPRTVMVGHGTEDGVAFTERTVQQLYSSGPRILGVKAHTVVDRGYENGLLTERTKDYFAQDTRGNVWYLGEDVTNYEYDDDGNLIDTNHESAWRAGRNGALPGFQMPKRIHRGFRYYQEHAPADGALDQARNLGILDQLRVRGVTYEHVLRVLETSASEPGLREIKYYARGVGLIREEEGVGRNLRNPTFVSNRVPNPTGGMAPVSAVPLPAPLALLLGAFAALAGLTWRRQRTTTLAPFGTRL